MGNSPATAWAARFEPLPASCPRTVGEAGRAELGPAPAAVVHGPARVIPRLRSPGTAWLGPIVSASSSACRHPAGAKILLQTFPLHSLNQAPKASGGKRAGNALRCWIRCGAAIALSGRCATRVLRVEAEPSAAIDPGPIGSRLEQSQKPRSPTCAPRLQWPHYAPAAVSAPETTRPNACAAVDGR